MTWKKILRLLALSESPLSGETIGRTLNITRSAVWKHIEFLSEKGFVIERTPKAGYRLVYPVDTPLIIDREDINLPTLGREVITHISTKSTNDDAICISDEVPEGTIVLAEHQSGGRGRRGRSWLSPFGKGLYFSIVLKPELPVFKVPRITLLVGVAVARALKRLGVMVRLKWPNDIIVNDRKIGGVLSELFVEGERTKYIVVGIGINVHTDYEDFTEEVKAIAGSLYTETGKVFSRREILKAIIEEIDSLYRYFCSQGGELGRIVKEWNEVAWKKGEEVFITTGEQKELCKICYLREDGALIVSKGGVKKEIYAGEILF